VFQGSSVSNRLDMVCVIVSSIATISSVAKSIREGYRCFKLWLQQARFSCIYSTDGFGLLGEERISRLSRSFYGLDGHNFDLHHCVP
jgi:hypothetical protein